MVPMRSSSRRGLCALSEQKQTFQSCRVLALGMGCLPGRSKRCARRGLQQDSSVLKNHDIKMRKGWIVLRELRRSGSDSVEIDDCQGGTWLPGAPRGAPSY